jgi:fibronectin type 3 domain-containing protein
MNQLRSHIFLTLLSFASIGTILAGCRKHSASAPESQRKGHLVTIAWDASPSSVKGYNVYRATKSGGPYIRLALTPASMTRYTDTAVEAGHSYFYVVTSVDPYSVEGAQSKEVTGNVPAQ